MPLILDSHSRFDIGNYMQVFSDLERSVCRMVHRQVIDSFFCDIQCRLEISYAGGTSSIYFL